MDLSPGRYRVDHVKYDECGQVIEVKSAGTFEITEDQVVAVDGWIATEISVGPMAAAHSRLLSMTRSIYERLVRDSAVREDGKIVRTTLEVGK